MNSFARASAYHESAKNCPMKIWFNKLNESRRSMVELDGDEIHIGRDPENSVVLKSPLVSRRHAVVRVNGDAQLELENVGVNSCLVGETEVLGGERVTFAPNVKVRIWPFTISFDADHTTAISRSELEAHLRTIVADLELRIHKKLLERLDLYDMETALGDNTDNILLLENNIEDVCRELSVFGQENEALLEEICGLALRDHAINQLIMETGEDQVFDLAALTANEFDVPATLVPERETELHSLLQFAREKLHLEKLPDISGKIHRIEERFADIFNQLRPHLHQELRKYLVLRMLKKDLKDIVFGFGPLQTCCVLPRSPKSWSSAATKSTSNATASSRSRGADLFPRRSPSRSSNASWRRLAGGSTRASRWSTRACRMVRV